MGISCIYTASHHVADARNALRGYAAAASQGHAHGAFECGLHVGESNGCEANQAAALAWFNLAAEKDFCPADFNLAQFYYRGIGGVARNFGAAIAMFRRAARHDHPPAYGNLGTMYMTGQGVTRWGSARWNQVDP
jgi:TPR repeat protein